MFLASGLMDKFAKIMWGLSGLHMVKKYRKTHMISVENYDPNRTQLEPLFHPFWARFREI